MHILFIMKPSLIVIYTNTLYRDPRLIVIYAYTFYLEVKPNRDLYTYSLR